MSAARTAAAALVGLACSAGISARAATGQAVYAAQCTVCHQASAAGAPGQYPPLKGRIDKIASSPEGRHYLAEVLVYGMVGRIDAGGSSYVGYMPAFRQLSDADIASVLSWLSALGDTKPAPVLAAADIAGVRGKSISASAVVKERTALAAVHPLP